MLLKEQIPKYISRAMSLIITYIISFALANTKLGQI